MVKPVQLSERSDFHRVSVRPRPAVNHLDLVQTVDGFGQGIVVAIIDTADRELDAGLGQTFGVADR